MSYKEIFYFLKFSKLKKSFFLFLTNLPAIISFAKNTKVEFSGVDGSVTTFTRDSQGKETKVKIEALGMTFVGVKQ